MTRLGVSSSGERRLSCAAARVAEAVYRRGETRGMWLVGGAAVRLADCRAWRLGVLRPVVRPSPSSSTALRFG
jgi:hypothetical protein